MSHTDVAEISVSNTTIDVSSSFAIFHATSNFLAVLQVFDVQWSVLRKYIQIYIQQDATLHSLFISWKNALHVLAGTSTHHQAHIQLYLQHLRLVKL